MTCPNCYSRKEEVAYFPRTHSLICLDPGCGWQRELSEDEIFDLLFVRRYHRLCA